MSEILLQKVSKSYGDHEIIKNVDLCIEDGQCTVLVGPSGCGKSTLLRLICGLENVSHGEVFIDSRRVTDIPPAKRGLAMVFQSYALYPHMSVFENMSFALRVRNIPKIEIEERVIKAAQILQIENLLNRKPKELSGGQRQRVAIGRAIVRNPKAFLFDEPLSNLDATLRHQMRYELAKLKGQLNTTMVYVTHDQEEAMTLADKIVVMNNGKIEQIGSPLQLYRQPANMFVAGFIGAPAINFLKCTFEEIKENSIIVAFSHEQKLSITIDDQNKKKLQLKAPYTIGIRPEDIQIFDNKVENGLQSIITLIENLGGESYVHASLQNGSSINVKVNGNFNKKPGDQIYISIVQEKCYLFDEHAYNIF